jgi:hypothetical protein
VTDEVPLGDIVLDKDNEGDDVGVTLLLDVPLDDAPTDSVVVGVDDSVEVVLEDSETLIVDEGDCEPVLEPVDVGVLVGEPVAVKDGLCDAVTDEVRESDPVLDELAPRLTLAVSDIEIDGERDDELVGVTDDVAVPDTV